MERVQIPCKRMGAILHVKGQGDPKILPLTVYLHILYSQKYEESKSK